MSAFARFVTAVQSAINRENGAHADVSTFVVPAARLHKYLALGEGADLAQPIIMQVPSCGVSCTSTTQTLDMPSLRCVCRHCRRLRAL